MTQNQRLAMMNNPDRHKHKWIPLMPTAEGSGLTDPDEMVKYALHAFTFGRLRDIYICTICRCTGHTIKSHRGGISRHDTDSSYKRGKHIADQYKIVLPIDSLTNK